MNRKMLSQKYSEKICVEEAVITEEVREDTVVVLKARMENSCTLFLHLYFGSRREDRS